MASGSGNVWKAHAVAIVVVLMTPVAGAAQSAAQNVLATKATCQPGDMVETGLQGQVPMADRVSGRAAMGYHCNLALEGAYGSAADDPTQSHMTGWATLDTYKNCAYYGDGNDAVGAGGTVVVDASDPAHPKQTAYLTTAAMQGPWESLRVNAARGLLVADHENSGKITGDPTGSSPLDVYDISGDCAHPKLLFSGNMPSGVGHEGWFQPDGTVYYMSGGSRVVPVDLTDPTHPKELGTWGISIHGGSTSQDGTRGYFCNTAPTESVVIVDTTTVARHEQTPEPKVIGRVPLPDNTACQGTYPVTYGEHPFVIQYGELSADTAHNCYDNSDPTFSHPHLIDIADERHPKVVAHWLTEVKLAENCPLVAGDHSSTLFASSAAQVVYSLFIYDTHHCTPDRLQDPTLLACGEFFSGLRVYDIRDPFHVKELAYWNNGTLMSGSQTVDFSAEPPRIRADRGEIYYDTDFGGLKIFKFEHGVYPFAETLTCPTRPDWVFTLYNQDTSCPVSSGARKPPAVTCEQVLVIKAAEVVGRHAVGRLRSARVYVNGKLVRRLRGAAIRTPLVLRRLSGKRVKIRITGRPRRGRTISRTVRRGLCHRT